MKKSYNLPQITIVEVELTDIIATSGNEEAAVNEMQRSGVRLSRESIWE